MALLANGAAAPVIEIASLDGRRRRLPANDAQALSLLCFFKVSCPTCQLTFPYLGRFHNRFASPEFEILGVSQDDDEATRGFVRRFDVGFPVLLEGSGYAASRAYGIAVVPTCFLVDADGNVILSTVGFVKKDLEELASRLGSALGKDGSPVWGPEESLPERKPG